MVENTLYEKRIVKRGMVLWWTIILKNGFLVSDVSPALKSLQLNHNGMRNAFIIK